MCTRAVNRTLKFCNVNTLYSQLLIAACKCVCVLCTMYIHWPSVSKASMPNPMPSSDDNYDKYSRLVSQSVSLYCYFIHSQTSQDCDILKRARVETTWSSLSSLPPWPTGVRLVQTVAFSKCATRTRTKTTKTVVS